MAPSFLTARLSDQMWVETQEGGKEHVVGEGIQVFEDGLLSAGTWISVGVGGAPIVLQAEKRNLTPNYHLQ